MQKKNHVVTSQGLQLMFASNIKTGIKCDLRGILWHFHRGIAVGAKQAVLSVTETAGLLGLSIVSQNGVENKSKLLMDEKGLILCVALLSHDGCLNKRYK